MGKPNGRLAIFVPSLAGGGAQRATIKLAQGLAERGHAVELVLARAEGPLLSEVPETVRIVDLGAPRVAMSIPALVRYLRGARPVAMLAVMNYANIVAIWARRLAGASTRLVVSERTTLSRSVRGAPSRRKRLLPMLVRRYYPWADSVVAVSNGVADDLAQLTTIPREDIRVIYNPIITPDLREKAKAPLIDSWFGASQPPVLLGVGRLDPAKDFQTLIRAFAAVRKRHRARLLILGEGRERPVLEALVTKLGLQEDVRISGFVTNPYPYMAQASLFVLSSRWEGLPGVLVEALFCGTPVVATDCQSGPREILADGKYGQLVPVGDVAALAESIVKGLNGKMADPSPSSWLPFEVDGVVSQYTALLLGTE